MNRCKALYSCEERACAFVPTDELSPPATGKCAKLNWRRRFCSHASLQRAILMREACVCVCTHQRTVAASNWQVRQTELAATVLLSRLAAKSNTHARSVRVCLYPPTNCRRQQLASAPN